MKKIILLAITFSIAKSVNAQTFFNGDRADLNSFYISKVEFEVDANLSNATSGKNFSTGSVPGLSAGVNWSIPLIEPFSVMPSLMYSQKGYSAATPFGKFTQRSQFIEMPILGKLTVEKFNIYLGPQISYQLSTTNNFDGDFPADMRRYYLYGGAKVTVQGTAGVGFEINDLLSLRARYTLDIKGRNLNGNPYLPAYRTQALQVGVAFNVINN